RAGMIVAPVGIPRGKAAAAQVWTDDTELWREVRCKALEVARVARESGKAQNRERLRWRLIIDATIETQAVIRCPAMLPKLTHRHSLRTQLANVRNVRFRSFPFRSRGSSSRCATPALLVNSRSKSTRDTLNPAPRCDFLPTDTLDSASGYR